MNKQQHFSIEELTADHPDWQEFVALVNEVNQADWAFIVKPTIKWTLRNWRG